MEEELVGNEEGLRAYWRFNDAEKAIQQEVSIADTRRRPSVELKEGSSVEGPGALPVAPRIWARGGDEMADVFWDERGAEVANQYRIYRAKGPDGGERSNLAAVGEAERSYVDGSPSNGTNFFYEMTAVNGEGQESDFALQAPVTPSERPFGNALSLSGDGDYAGVSDRQSLDIDGELLTMEAWVKHDGTSDEDARIIDKIGNDVGYQLSLVGSGEEVRVQVFLNFIGFATASVTSGREVQAGRWTHVAAVYDGEELRLYLNGEATGTAERSGTIGANSRPLRLGTNTGFDEPTSNFFSGKIDEVRLWDVARSQEDIQSAMEEELVGNEEGLRAYWRLSEPAGTAVSRGAARRPMTAELKGEADFAESIQLDITGLSPESIVGEGKRTLSIFGGGFDPGATVRLTRGDRGAPNPGDVEGTVVSQSLTEIRAEFGFSTVDYVGEWDVVVENPGGETARQPLFVLPGMPVVEASYLNGPDFSPGENTRHTLRLTNRGNVKSVALASVLIPPSFELVGVNAPGGEIVSQTDRNVLIAQPVGAGASRDVELDLKIEWDNVVPPDEEPGPDQHSLGDEIRFPFAVIGSPTSEEWEAVQQEATGTQELVRGAHWASLLRGGYLTETYFKLGQEERQAVVQQLVEQRPFVADALASKELLSTHIRANQEVYGQDVMSIEKSDLETAGMSNFMAQGAKANLVESIVQEAKDWWKDPGSEAAEFTRDFWWAAKTIGTNAYDEVTSGRAGARLTLQAEGLVEGVTFGLWQPNMGGRSLAHINGLEQEEIGQQRFVGSMQSLLIPQGGAVEKILAKGSEALKISKAGSKVTGKLKGLLKGANQADDPARLVKHSTVNGSQVKGSVQLLTDGKEGIKLAASFGSRKVHLSGPLSKNVKLFLGNGKTYEVPAGTITKIAEKGQDAVEGLPRAPTDKGYCNQGSVRLAAAFDPNRITASPDGRFIHPSQQLSYFLQFENLPEANLPATNVTVELPVDEDLDVSSAQFHGSSHPDVMEKTVDPAAGTITWTFEGIDLPPNDDPPEGEGWIRFSMDPKESVSSGTALESKATITFDDNPPIETNISRRVVDRDAPESQAVSLPDITGETSFPVDFEASDATSGVEKVHLWVAKEPIEEGGAASLSERDSSDEGGSPAQGGETKAVTLDGREFILEGTASTETGSFDFEGEHGMEYHFFTTAVDTVGNKEQSPDQIDGNTTIVAPPSPPQTIGAEPEAVASEGVSRVQLDWSPVEEEDAAGFELFRGLVAGFDTTGTHLATVGPDTSAFADTTAQIGQTYYYRVLTRDTLGLRSALSSEQKAFLYSSDVPVIASESFGDASSAEDYRLVALPGDVDRPLSKTISGEPGKKWQAFWDDGSAENFFQKYDGSEVFSFQPGRGFWLTHTEGWSVKEAVPSVDLKGDSAATIDVHDGWNIVSNPLDKGVSWATVNAAHSDILRNLWQFDGSFAQADTFQSAKAGKAFYFLNDVGLDSLRVPYPGAPASKVQAKDQEESPLFTIMARPKGMESPTSAVKVGFDESAAEGLGRLDEPAPPGQFSPLSLRLRVLGDAPKRRRAVKTERRPPETGPEEGQTFRLRLRTEIEGPVQITAQGLDEVGSSDAALLRPSTGRSYDLSAGEAITLEAADSTGLKLAVGSSSYIQDQMEEILPDEVTLTSYPNPMGQQATLEYTLPEATDVRIAIYDMLGRRVAVLEEGRKEAGRHAIKLGARRLSSGVYFGRLAADGETRTQKITVIR